MKDPQAKPAAADEQLLQHYRRHQDQEPSAALDARILDAAREQAGRHRSRLGWRERLQAWLFGHGTGLRWSLALGSVAVLGLGLSLSLKTFEQAPAQFDSPLPAAPALQRQAAPAQKKSMAESARLAAPAAEAMADSVAEQPRSMAPPASGKGEAPDVALHEAVQEILELRASGRRAEADERIEALRRDYPRLDIDALLGSRQGTDAGGE
ncbi:hypothetical protein SBP02_12540 [Pseudomonas benzenivorans]|uniref:Uncharacterized protein n=1 Tax=Pseudomonas benzenivorans TaxID=556533 RepID=A0ABZ0PR17_9PSED|nr:hypothetical protein [Pseudomonas benzenivorans]WPC03608.1 hypothetical protein SBP02_12540 [Pseudomonas benzenivorans]